MTDAFAAVSDALQEELDSSTTEGYVGTPSTPNKSYSIIVFPQKCNKCDRKHPFPADIRYNSTKNSR